MMHSTLHFSLGMVVGTALTYRPLLDAWRRKAALAPHLRRWLIVAYGLGVYAIVPNLLRRAGVPHDLCEAWFMNIFLLSSALNRSIQGSALYGPFVMGILVTAQYAVLLRAIHRSAPPA
ncbi:MAG: hypothetical protein ISS31_07040 [Kiritimatiellae bacterium]|nr:hypothetical protein [Kiritimatiellia bacterium]